MYTTQVIKGKLLAFIWSKSSECLRWRRVSNFLYSPYKHTALSLIVSPNFPLITCVVYIL